MSHIKPGTAVILLLSFIACRDEPFDLCTNQKKESGPFYLSTETINQFPYSADDDSLYFVDAQNMEFLFVQDSTIRVTDVDMGLIDCPFDTQQQILHLQTRERLTTYFHSDALNLKFRLAYHADGITDNATVIRDTDLLTIDVANEGSALYTEALIVPLKNKVGYYPQSTFQIEDQFVLNSLTFDEVYVPGAGNHPITIWDAYYNHDQGIVGLKNLQGSQTLALSRIE